MVKFYPISRRRFLRRTTLAMAGLATANHLFALDETCDNGVSIVVGRDDAIVQSASVQWALQKFQQVLQSRELSARLVPSMESAGAGGRIVAVCSANAPMAKLVAESTKVTLPTTPEAFVLTPGMFSGKPVLAICAKDARGLVYGLLELADRILCEASVADALTIGQPIMEKSANVVRSICRSFQSDVEDKPWFNDRSFWEEYLSMLATERFNRFNLSFGLGYNDAAHAGVTDAYLLFVYPFLVAVPGYSVSATNLPDEERDQNLQMLSFISEECAKRSLDFQLGLWTHSYQYGPKAKPNHEITGLTPEKHAPYCRDALSLILKACPGITGLTFRVHSESGIPKGSYPFWQTVFNAVTPLVEAGRILEIDLHAKECTQHHIDAALAAKARVVISPKYCGEHQGLPYHPLSLESPERSKQADTTILDGQASRYGYSNFLKEDRPFGVLHRIWPGTQRVLLTGDPVFSAGYGRYASFCGSLGVEWNEPLSFKGREGSGIPGGRCGYSDATLNPDRDFQKYLYSYRVWGRLIHNPDSDPQVWRRMLASQFGKPAQPAVEEALANASRILLMALHYHGASADNHSFWPEMYTNLSIVKNKLKTSFDPQMFLDVDPTAEAILKGKIFGQDQYSTLEFSQWMEDRAEAVSANLTHAKALVTKANDPAFRRLEVDVAMQGGLGLFFARKFRSAVLWSIYQKTNDENAKTAAIEMYGKAKDAWSDVAGHASVYLNNVSYGPESTQHGHWKDRLTAIANDIEAMNATTLTSVTARTTHAGAAPQAIARALGRVSRPVTDCTHTPPAIFWVGQPLTLSLSSGTGSTAATLYYRHVNQADTWNSMPMTGDPGNYQAIIPDAYTQTDYPLQYYFALTKDDDRALFPGFNEQFSNQPYFTVRSVAV